MVDKNDEKTNDKTQRVFKYIRNVSLQVLTILLIISLVSEFVGVELDYYLNVGIISFVSALFFGYSSYKLIHTKYTASFVLISFFSSALVLIASNLYFFDILSKIHPILYSILTGSVVTFSFLAFDRHKETDDERLKKVFPKYLKTIFLILFLIGLLAFSFFLRVNETESISPGRDSYHHYIAAMSINDHGSTVYTTQPYINHMLALLFSFFGQSFFIARLPFVIAGALSVVMVYFIARKISVQAAVISSLLFAICPWAIGLSRYVREYSLNILYELIFIYFILFYPKKLETKKEMFMFGSLVFILSAIIFILGITQKGLTISLIIALAIATIVRIGFDYDIIFQAKSIISDKKKLALMINAVIVMSTILVAIIIIFKFYERIMFTYQPMWFFFFQSEATHPMLWYSFMQVPWYFILFLTAIPLFAKIRDKVVWTSFFIFYGYLIFFVFLAEPHREFLYARYMYTALPFFTILLGVSISYMISVPARFARNKLIKAVFVLIPLIFAVTVFNPVNTYIASNVLVSSIEEDGRMVISIEYWKYDDILGYLEEAGFTKDDIIIASELRIKNVIAWHFDMDFYEGRTITSFNGIDYDIADNMYIIDENAVDVIKENDEGWIVRRDGDILPEDITLNSLEDAKASAELSQYLVELEFMGKYGKYEVYRWYKDKNLYSID